MLRKVKRNVETQHLKPGDFITDSRERWEIMIPPPGITVEKVERNRQGGILVWFQGAERPELWNDYYSWAIERMEDVKCEYISWGSSDDSDGCNEDPVGTSRYCAKHQGNKYVGGCSD